MLEQEKQFRNFGELDLHFGIKWISSRFSNRSADSLSVKQNEWRQCNDFISSDLIQSDNYACEMCVPTFNSVKIRERQCV